MERRPQSLRRKAQSRGGAGHTHDADERLTAQLRAGGTQAPDGPTARVLTPFALAGVFDGPAVLVGTHASLDYLMEATIQAALPVGAGILGSVPAPARFALHKLIVAAERPADVSQSVMMARPLDAEGRRGDPTPGLRCPKGTGQRLAALPPIRTRAPREKRSRRRHPPPRRIVR